MQRTARGLFTRSLAALALVATYGLTTLGASTLVLGTPKAEARGRGGRRGGFGRGGRRGGFGRRGGWRGGRRGWRGRRGGFGLYIGPPAYYDGCWWSPRRGRWVCPYW